MDMETRTTLLTPQQAETLRAAIDRLIPPDDYPGGWESGAGEYLLREMDRSGALTLFADAYRAGLDALDAEARSAAGCGFAALDPAAQDRLLERVERGDVQTEWGTTAPKTFLRAFAEHVMEGYYSDPANGGNRNGISWKMIGFEVRG